MTAAPNPFLFILCMKMTREEVRWDPLALCISHLT